MRFERTNSQLEALDILAAAIFSLLAFFTLPAAMAASPSSGAIGPTSPAVSWNGTATGGVSANESTCVEGLNCDTFTLTVSGAPTDWVGKLVSIEIDWNNPLNDYDLYVHKDSISGPLVARSAGGAPEITERTTINPVSTGTGLYAVHVVYFSVTPVVDQYRGTILSINRPASRVANYVKGGMTFSPNVRTLAPVATADGEPSSRTDLMGNHYVTGIRGVPAGIDLWYFDLQPGSPTYDPNMRNPIYRGQPDSFTGSDLTSVGADGGGDVDIAVGFGSPAPPFSPGAPILASTSLVAANISTQRSTDRGATFAKNPAGSAPGIPIDDRQWIEFFGTNTVYLFYRTLAPALSQIQRSNDGGLTYGPAATAGLIGQAGGISVDQSDGTVYISGSSGMVCAGVPVAPGLEPLTYNCNQAVSDSNGVAHLFVIVKVAADGTAYVAYSNDRDIFLAHSTNRGQSWSLPVRVSDGPETLTSVFPTLVTGPLPGSVGVAWYATSEAVNNDNANWQVFFAQSFNAKDNSPTFQQVAASDHFIHASNISEGGTLGNANRNLLDYFQISFDPVGAAVIDYTDDHNDFNGHTYATRQISGPSIRGGSIPAPVEGSSLPDPPSPPADGSQVVDFPHDVADALLVVTPTDDPLDILSIKYSCETGSNGPVIVATMKVSGDLTTPPPVSNWRMNFTANAPFSQLSPTGDYSFGLSDRGDQFFVRATTDPTLSSFGPFVFGTTVRNSDGSLTSTIKGPADSGSFDPVSKTITVKVSANKLNPFVTHGPSIGTGSTLVGLRGSTFTSGANAKRDIARGGTQYTIACGGGGGTDGGVGGPDGGGGGGSDGGSGGTDGGIGGTCNPGPCMSSTNIIRVTGGGSIDGHVRNFGFNAESQSGHLNYQDHQEGFHLVSTSITSFCQTGPNQITFSGTGTIDRDVVNFTVTAQDNGEPGTNDVFGITITGSSHNSSHCNTLSTGNIKVHR